MMLPSKICKNITIIEKLIKFEINFFLVIPLVQNISNSLFLSYLINSKKTEIPNTKGKIVVADTCSLGNRQFLMVAQYGDEKHLLGVSSSSINHLAKLEIVSEEIKHKKQVLPSGEINANA